MMKYMLLKDEEGKLGEERLGGRAPAMIPVMGNEVCAEAAAGMGCGAEVTGLTEVNCRVWGYWYGETQGGSLV